MSSLRSKANRPCGCGETNYSYITSEKNPYLQIHCCRKCSHRWLKEVKPERTARRAYKSDEEDDR